jgi:tripeptidyl-peptidase I
MLAVTRTVLFGLLLTAGGVLGAPPQVKSRSPYVVKDSHYVPRKWTQKGAAPAEHTIRLSIGLKQSQFDELERHLYESEVPQPLST